MADRAGLERLPPLHPADPRDLRPARLPRPTPATRSSPAPTCAADDELDAFVREHVESAYHPCGTARLGRRDDPLAVVDPDCRVIGVDGLRVADSSIFPRITNGNLNAPSIMVGEKAADHILGRRLAALQPRAVDQPALARVATADRRVRRRAQTLRSGKFPDRNLVKSIT